MLVALIGPIGHSTATAEGTDIPGLRARLIAETRAGEDMVSADVELKRGGMRVVTGKFEGRREPIEIEAEGIDALHAKLPEGWQRLAVLRA